MTRRWTLMDSAEFEAVRQAMLKLSNAYTNNTGKPIPKIAFEGETFEFLGPVSLEDLASYGVFDKH